MGTIQITKALTRLWENQNTYTPLLEKQNTATTLKTSMGIPQKIKS
jgi:hypothetical protein